MVARRMMSLLLRERGSMYSVGALDLIVIRKLACDFFFAWCACKLRSRFCTQSKGVVLLPRLVPTRLLHNVCSHPSSCFIFHTPLSILDNYLLDCVWINGSYRSSTASRQLYAPAQATKPDFFVDDGFPCFRHPCSSRPESNRLLAWYNMTASHSDSSSCPVYHGCQQSLRCGV